MQTIDLYRYTRPDGGITVSPVMPDVPYTAMYRLVADEGKEISSDGVNWTYCTDTDDPNGWMERTAREEDEANGEDYPEPSDCTD